MGEYPITLQIAGRPCVVIGGGVVSERKTQALLQADARVKLIAPDPTPVLSALAETHEIVHYPRAYRDGDLEGAFLAIVATDDRSVQRAVATEAEGRGVLVNVADAPELCSFIAPATARRGMVLLGVSTGGASPLMAGRLCRDLAQHISPAQVALVELLGKLRERLPPGAERRRVLAELVDSDVIQLMCDGRREEVDALLQRLAGDHCSLERLGVTLDARVSGDSGDD